MRFPLLSLEHGGGELHSLAAICDAGPQKQRTQMLFHSPGADVQLLRDLLVAASFHEQMQNLFVAACDFDIAKIQHGASSSEVFVAPLIDSNSIA
jgi:hypothetical protein